MIIYDKIVFCSMIQKTAGSKNPNVDSEQPLLLLPERKEIQTMALSACGALTNIHDRELEEHGSIEFPIAAYHDDLVKFQVPWHWHEEWEYAIATEKEAVFLLENDRVRLQPGEGIFINAKALHGVEGSGRLHSAVFHQRLIGGNPESIFWQKLVQPLLSDERFRYLALRPDSPWQARVLREFETAWQLLQNEPEDFENEVRYRISKGIGILVNNCNFSTSKLSDQELAEAERIRVMLEYIEAHYREEIQVQDIADTAAVSPSVCLRCFQKTLGTSPMQYVKQYRIRKAAGLLEKTNLTAKDIAFDCGFNDVSYFTKIFREQYGCTPAAYRKKKLEETAHNE